MASSPPTSVPATTRLLTLAMQAQTLQSAPTSGRQCTTLGAITMRTAGWTTPAYHGTSVTQVHPKMMMTTNLLQALTSRIHSLPPHRAMTRNLTRTWTKETTLAILRTTINLRALEMLKWTAILLHK